MREEKKRTSAGSLNYGNVYALRKGRSADKPLDGGRSAVIEDFARCAKTFAVAADEAARMQWLNDRIEMLACCREEYIHSLFSKYNLDEDQWEYDAPDSRFVRKRAYCPRSP